MRNNKQNAFVIGSGIAGIASSIRLAVKGYHVTVFESNDVLGGKLGELKSHGFRFDTGPSLFTLPYLVDELFVLAGKNPADYFRYKRWNTSCVYFFQDGTRIPFSANKDQLFQEVEQTLGVSALPLKKRLEHSEYLFDKTSKTFLERSLHEFKSYLSIDILKTIAAIPNLDLFRTMHESNADVLNHPKLVQIFDRYATYNGSNPYQAPGILNIIPHLEHGIGTYFPQGGMRAIVHSLIDLATSLGVEFKCNSRVSEVVHDTKKIQGIIVNGENKSADVIVCNADIKAFYDHLLPRDYVRSSALSQEPSSSALIFYWGIKKKFDQLDLHNIFFSEDYETEFQSLFDAKDIHNDPTIYIHISSKADASDAPADAENWFVMVNAPYNTGQDWNETRERVRKSILNKLSIQLGIDIESLIVFEEYLDPVRIEERTSSYKGALYGTSSNDRMAAFFRHPNRSKLKGLYFAGGSVHPGGGIPLCLLSAKIAADLVHP